MTFKKVPFLDMRHGYREKGKMPREPNRSPRDQTLHSEPYRHKMRDHDHSSPRERLLNLENRDLMSVDLNNSIHRERERGSSEYSPFDRHYNRRESGGGHDGSSLRCVIFSPQVFDKCLKLQMLQLKSAEQVRPLVQS